MCGIIAYLGRIEGGKFVIDGIKILRNRGYDSVGCSSVRLVGEKRIHHLTKFARRPDLDCYLPFEETFEEHQGSHNLIAHTRWATTGEVNDLNSHPHLDTVLPSRFALVHNGIINNYQKLKKFLLERGVKFQSDTDTEVIVNLLAYYYQESLDNESQSSQGLGEEQMLGSQEDQLNDRSRILTDALKLTLNDLEGTWALLIQDLEDPEVIYVCKNGSPILVGYNDEMCIISSEVSGFQNHLRHYHVVADHQILKIRYRTGGKVEFFRDDHLTELSSHQVVSQSKHAMTPDPYPHWTLKEISEQPQSVMWAINGGGRLGGKNRVKIGGLERDAEKMTGLLEIKDLIIIASGTSLHAGILGRKYLQAISGFRSVTYVDASEFVLRDLVGDHCGVLVLSQSGETRDVVRCIELIRTSRPEVMIFSIVNAVESLIAREADCGVYLNAGREVGVASTKSFTSQSIVMILLSIWFAQNRGLAQSIRARMISSLNQVDQLVSDTLEGIKDQCGRLIDSEGAIGLSSLKTGDDLFLLGKDRGLSIAMEGALKIKEISYLHAEAYASGGLKHGPLALITDGTPVIVIRIGDLEQICELDISAKEVKSRGAFVVSVSSKKSTDQELYDAEIIIPEDRCLEPVLAVIPLQYLAYLLALKFGYDPDYPRNLAKCVTVA